MVSLFREASSILSRSISQLQQKLSISKSTNTETEQESTTKPSKEKKSKRRESRKRSSSSKFSTTAASSTSSNSCSKDIVFYFETYRCPEATRQVMTEHGVVNKLLEAHIKHLQDKAWEIFPYPCIGLFEFVRFNLPTYPAYAHVLSLLRAGGVYLDVGCCVGQDLRYLYSHECIPGYQLFGADLQREFIDIGHELFLDSPTDTGIRMQAADIFDSNSWLATEMPGRCAVVHAGYFLHLFDHERQIQAAVRLVGFLTGKSGDVVVGRMIGSQMAGEYLHPTVGVMMRHNRESFNTFWEVVGRHAGRKLRLDVVIGESTVRVSHEGKRFDHPPEEKATEITFCVYCE